MSYRISAVSGNGTTMWWCCARMFHVEHHYFYLSDYGGHYAIAAWFGAMDFAVCCVQSVYKLWRFDSTWLLARTAINQGMAFTASGRWLRCRSISLNTLWATLKIHSKSTPIKRSSLVISTYFRYVFASLYSTFALLPARCAATPPMGK